MPSVVCIAGLDPSGYSGLSADFRALGFLGIRCLPIVSTLTVQNANMCSESHPVSPGLIERQLDAIFAHEKPGAVKLGVLGNRGIAEKVSEFLSTMSVPVVTDPVFASSTGFMFADDGMIEAYRQAIIPVTSIVTPNAHEATMISGLQVDNPEDAIGACQHILELGPSSVLLKGGHFKESVGTDVFYDSSGAHILEGPKLDVKVRGTGCAYSSLIAGYTSMDMPYLRAVKLAKEDMISELSVAATARDPYLFGRGRGADVKAHIRNERNIGSMPGGVE